MQRLLALACTGLLLASCTPPRRGSSIPVAPPADVTRTPPERRLVVASKNRIDSIDPAAAYTFGAMQVLNGLGDTLYRIDAGGQVRSGPMACGPGWSCAAMCASTTAARLMPRRWCSRWSGFWRSAS
jgi:ABC-type oligopeptide transport system substrate-binding subunit